MSLNRFALNLVVFMTCLLVGMLVALGSVGKLPGSVAQHLPGSSDMQYAAEWAAATGFEETPRGVDGKELVLETATLALG